MAELLFILVTLYVAYVVFKVVECEKQQRRQKSPAAKPKTVAAKPQVAVKSEPAAASTAPKPAPAKSTPAPKPAAARTNNTTTLEPGTVKNPDTGEVSKIASNYRFMKRWIKEALVEEGLLEKIYKNTELDKETIAKINEALEKLKAMAKYQ